MASVTDQVKPRVLETLKQQIREVDRLYQERNKRACNAAIKSYHTLIAQAEATYGFEETVRIARQAAEECGIMVSW